MFRSVLIKGLKPEVWKKLDALVKETDTSYSRYCRKLIEWGINEYGDKKEKTGN